MALIDLHAALEPWNDHWRTGRVSPLIKKYPHRRRAFGHLRGRVQDLPFQVLAGPRQVGKTTLAGHLIEDIIASGTPPTQVLYAPMDIPRVASETRGRLDPIVRAFERFVLKAPLKDATGKVFFFLDEIHTLQDWSLELKALYDEHHPTLRVLATGSSSAALANPATADLPGRVANVHLYPLKFAEALEVRKAKELGPGEDTMFQEARRVRDELKTYDHTPPARARLAAALDALWTSTPRAVAENEFDRYLLTGGYPGPVTANDPLATLAFHQTTVDTILSKDLKLYPRLRKPGAFQIFLALMARDQGGKFSANRYGADLEVDKETPAHWKAVAEDLFVVHQLRAMGPTFRPLFRKADKAYIQDAGLRAFLAARPDAAAMNATGEIGLVVEGVLYDHLRRLQFNLFGHRLASIGYLARPEVDFVVQLPRSWLLVESKYSQRPQRETRPARADDRGRPDALPLVASRNEYSVGGPEWVVPAWMLALIA